MSGGSIFDQIKNGATLIIEDPVEYYGFTQAANVLLMSDLLQDEEYRVYMAIRSFAYGNKINCFPGQETIGRLIGKSRQRVNRIIHMLVQKGLLKIFRRGQKLTNIYVICRIPESFIKRHDELLRENERLMEDKTANRCGSNDVSETTHHSDVSCTLHQDHSDVPRTLHEEYKYVVVDSDQQEKNSRQEAATTNLEKPAPKPEPKSESESDNTIREIQEFARSICAADLPAVFIAGLLKEYPPERIKEKIELIGAGAGQIRNLPGLLLAALRDNYVNIPGKPALKERGENNNNISRAGPEKEYRDINWQPADQKEKSSKNRRDLLDELYVR